MSAEQQYWSTCPARPRLLGALFAVILGATFGLVPLTAPANAGTPIDSIAATSPRVGAGTITPNGEAYNIVVPFFAIGVPHQYELKRGTEVVDSFSFTVPREEGPSAVIPTTKGGTAELVVSHSGGINGSPSKGTGTYKPKAEKAKKKKKKKKAKKTG